MFFRKKKAPSTPEGKSLGKDATPSATSSATPADQAAGAPGLGGGGGSDLGTSTTQFLTGDQALDRQAVQVLLEAIGQVSSAPVASAQDLEVLLVKIVDLSIRVTGAERGMLLLESPGADGADSQLDVAVARSDKNASLESDVKFSTSIARRVLDSGQPLKATVQSDSEALELGRSVFDLKLRAVMCVALSPPPESLGEGEPPRPLGALYVDSRAAARQFQARDLSLFAALASQISATMQKARLHLDSLEKVRLEQSLELASTIQRDLMPGTAHQMEGFELHGWYRAAEQAAGDFYDVVKAKGGRLGVLVGDVTGHGIGPALITAAAQASLRSYLRLVDDPGEVVTLVNQDLCERMDDGRFLTLFVALLSPDGSLATINAGHPPPLLWRAADKSCTEVPGSGPALGMIDDEQYTAESSIKLEPGDALFAFTDGAIEARPADQYEGFLGEQGLRDLFMQSMQRGDDARTSATFLAEAILAHGENFNEDDLTLVVVRATP